MKVSSSFTIYVNEFIQACVCVRYMSAFLSKSCDKLPNQKVKSFASYFKVSKDEILSKIRKNMQFYLLFQFVDVRNFVLIAVSYKLM